MSMQTKLKEVIVADFEELENHAPGSKERAALKDEINTFMNAAIKIDELESSEIQNEERAKEERKIKIGQIAVDVGKFILGLGATALGAYASFRFEEKGTISSRTGGKLVDRFISRYK